MEEQIQNIITPNQTPQIQNIQYTTNVNELISQPNVPSKTQFFLETLFELSHYLFQKKHVNGGDEVSFDDYLSSVSKEINTYDNMHRKAKLAAKLVKLQNTQNASSLLQCLNHVPYIYFQPKFLLDFGELAKNKIQIKNKQEDLNDQLDHVQINLFSQIHCKFHEYFKVVANLDYLNQSLDTNIAKNKQARARINKVKSDFVDKSKVLKKKITHRQNLQKLLKTIKIIKSLKKLPSIIKQILQSSLPYQCLSLLKSTKQSLSLVQNLLCLTKTSQTIKQSESLVQMGLNKKYSDELYMYLQQCQNVDLEQGWDRINSNGCMDNSTLNTSMVGVSGILEESILDMNPSTSKNKRNEGRQFQMAMILLESYKFVDFPADLMRIKIANSLRIFCKRFDGQLTNCIRKVLQEKHESVLYQQNNQAPPLPNMKTSQSNDQQSSLRQVVQKITVIFYVKHLYSFNEVMKDTLDRLFGCIYTLLQQYKQSKQKDDAKFVQLFKEQLSILPSIVKVIIQKLKFLMSLKNINDINFSQFKQWINVLEYWRRYTDNLIDDNSLINYQGPNQQINDAINDCFKKILSIFNIEQTINQMVLNYISMYHSNKIKLQLEPCFQEQQTWQAIQIPSQFVDVLNNISQWHQTVSNFNNSVTILNESSDLKNRSISQDFTSLQRSSCNKFRVLKSNVMVDGVRYKISVSFVLLCEFLDQYVKMNRSLPNCHKFIYERSLDLAQYYNNRTKQLIYQAKVLSFQKMKSKKISAKHVCLMHNCLSVLSKLIKQINYEPVKQFKSITLQNIDNHRRLLINKLSNILKSKVDTSVAQYLINKEKENYKQRVSQTNLTLLTMFVSMMGIIQQNLDFEQRKNVFREAINIFVTKYFKELVLKGADNVIENKILVEKLKFLRQYFPEELEAMEKEVRKSSS